MNTERIDSQKCPPKSVWGCWLAIAGWMVACIVNAVWLNEDYGILDGIGFCILFVCIPWLLIEGIIRRDKNILESWQGLSMVEVLDYKPLRKVFRVILHIVRLLIKLTCKPLQKGMIHIVGFCRNTISYVFLILFFVGISIDEHRNDIFTSIYLLLWLLFLGGILLYYGYFIIKLFSVIVLFIALFYFKFIYFAVMRYSGRLRRTGIDVIIMLLVFVVFMTNVFSEWLIDSLVIASLSLFLFDVYRIAGLEIRNVKYHKRRV